MCSTFLEREPNYGLGFRTGKPAPAGSRTRAIGRSASWLCREHLNQTLDAVFELLYDPASVIVRGGSVGAYDDDALQALVAIAEQHDIKLVLCDSNHRRALAEILIGADQKHADDCGVKHTDGSATAQQARIVDLLETMMNQHRLAVGSSVIEQDFDGAKRNGKRRPMISLRN